MVQEFFSSYAALFTEKAVLFRKANPTSAAIPPHSSAAQLCGRFTAKLY
jgi:hypothetical protein